MRLFRLFSLMDVLRVRTQPVTARELSRHMGVSLRTIYRDIADLQTLGAPIRGEGGIGYVMEKGFFMPSLNFEGDELEALALGAKLVMARSGDTLAAAAHRASAKIASAIGDTPRHEFLNSPLEAGPSRTAMDSVTGALHDELRRAIRDRAIIKIEYLSLSGEMTTRLACPLGLTVFDSAWLLTIWCKRSKDFRHLRVDRIKSAARTGDTFRHERGKMFADALAREGERIVR